MSATLVVCRNGLPTLVLGKVGTVLILADVSGLGAWYSSAKSLKVSTANSGLVGMSLPLVMSDSTDRGAIRGGDTDRLKAPGITIVTSAPISRVAFLNSWARGRVFTSDPVGEALEEGGGVFTGRSGKRMYNHAMNRSTSSL